MVAMSCHPLGQAESEFDGRYGLLTESALQEATFIRHHHAPRPLRHLQTLSKRIRYVTLPRSAPSLPTHLPM